MAKTGPRRPTLAIAVLFLVSLGQGVTLPLLPALSQTRGDEARLLGIVYGSHAAARILTQPFGGLWVDRAGAARVIVVATLLYLASLVGFLFTSSPIQTLGLRVASGVASGLAQPAIFAIVMQGVPVERQGRRVSTVLGIGASGMVVGPVLAALFAPRDLRLPVVIALVPTAIVALAVGVVAARTGAEASTRAATLKEELAGMRRLFLDGALVAMVLPIAFNKITFGAFQALLPVYGEASLDLGRRGVSIAFLATGVAFAAIQPVAGRLADRFSPRSLTVALTPVLLVDLASMSFVPGRAFFFASYMLYIVVSSIIFVATLKLVTKTYGADGRHGGVWGSAATLTDPFTVLGPVVFMSVYATVKVHTFLAMAITGVLSGALFARYTRRLT